MRKFITMVLFCVLLFSLAGCNSVPAGVAEYANKHEMEVLAGDKLESKSVVGKEYVVYGTISSIFVNTDEQGRSTSYTVMFSRGPIMKYTTWANVKPLNVNRDDEVAFVVSCEEGYSAGSYSYVIQDKVWESRHSEKTAEEECDTN